MPSYFLCDVNVEYEGLSFDDFVKIWLEEAEMVMKIKESKPFHVWKVVGERRVLSIAQNAPDGLDQALMRTPIVAKLGNQVHVKVMPLRTYESFASDMFKSIDPSKEPFEHKNPVDRKGIFYWLRFEIKYKNIDMHDFLKTWVEEANYVFSEKKKGVIFDLWKAVGENVIHGVLCVDNPDMLDQITFNLPLVKNLGNQVHITVKSLRDYGAFRDDLKKWCKTDQNS